MDGKSLHQLLLRAFPPCLSDPAFPPPAAKSISPVYATVGSVTSMHAPDDERSGTLGKTPQYSGIGPVDESGIPAATRTVSRP